MTATSRASNTGIPVYRIPGYRRKYGRYWYRYCTM